MLTDCVIHLPPRRFVVLIQDRGKETVFVGEVVIHRPFGDARRGHDVSNRRCGGDSSDFFAPGNQASSTSNLLTSSSTPAVWQPDSAGAIANPHGSLTPR